MLNGPKIPLKRFNREKIKENFHLSIVWEDPLWTIHGEQARKQGGYGGMDFIMNYRLVRRLREGLAPDSDVYDAADWSAPGPLSEQSTARRSAPVDFPDFRRAYL
jgi:hypothetical protein